MNKKIYAGMIAFGIAASFWACGSGEIINPSENDLTMKEMAKLPDGEVIAAFDATLEMQCPECKIPSTPSSSSKTTNRRSSSSTTPVNRFSSSSIVIYTSSSDGTGPSYSSSSQSGPVPVYSSSSSVIIVGPGSEAGTCGPKEPVVNRGDSVTWVFNNEPTKFPNGWILRSTFVWTTSDGLPASATVSNYNGVNHKVYYSASGKHNALLHIDVNNSSYDLTCTPVQVNGAPITGCKCKAADPKPDITVGGAWTVTGCTSPGAQITGYEWLGAVGSDTSATQTFTAKNQMAAPVVNVSNDDNTVFAVQCDTVISTDKTAPDYLFEIEGQLPQDPIQVKNKGCMSIRGKWSNPGYHPSVSVLCSMKADSSPVSFTMTYKNKTYSDKGTQSWGFSNVGGEIGMLNDGDVAFDNICVEFTGAETVECKLQ